MKQFLIVLSLISFSLGLSAQKHKVISLDDNSFKEQIFDYSKDKEWKFKGDKVAIIDFYATWCGPCRRVAPILEQLQEEYGDRLQIYKVDTDQAKAVSAAFGITSLPTFLFIPMNDKPTMAKGGLPKETFVKAINDVLKIAPIKK